tara:strand:+ start:366 stop:653 length:288 start_codon:yes stop_codon:yes gene_type:complete
MYVQVSSIDIYPGKLEQIKTIFQESVLPLIENQPGFVKFHLYSNEKDNIIIVNSFWNTKENIETVFTSGIYQEQVSKFEKLFSSSPIRSVFEVSI